MPELPVLNAAFQLDASDNIYLNFGFDTSHTLFRDLDDVPENFLSMDFLEWTVEYNQEGRVDDTLSLSIRIVNGSTILAAADSVGTFQTVQANVTNTTDVTTGPVFFFYVNSVADKATWNGAVVELHQEFSAVMMADGCRIRVDYVEFTGSYTSDIDTFQLDHTTDLSIGFFHTTDVLISEFSSPAATTFGTSPTFATKTVVDDGGTVWMVGISGTNIRLWEGPGPPGFWQLHEFAVGSGIIRDVGLAAIGNMVHVIYIHHGGSAIQQRHLIWEQGGDSWVNNGAFGQSESHSDPLASVLSQLDVAATSDGELVVSSALFNFVSFSGAQGGSTFRARTRIYRSVDESFSGVGNLLHHQYFGISSFSRPPISPPMINAIDARVLLGWGVSGYSVFDGSGAEGVRQQGPDTRYPHIIRSGGFGDLTSVENSLSVGGRHYRHRTHNASLANDGHVGWLSGLLEDDELVVDDSRIVDAADAAAQVRLFVDDHGRVGVFAASTFADTLTIWINSGFGWFSFEYEDSFTPSSLPHYYIANRTVDRTLSVWQHNPSGAWTYWGFTIPHWFIAHSTDIVIGPHQVNHTTDLMVANPVWGITSEWSNQSPMANWVFHDGSYYRITFRDRAFTTIWVWRAESLNEPGHLITTWGIERVPGSDGLERLNGFDFVIDDGTIHFVLCVYNNNRFEYHHSEYDITGDSWTHHGSFHNSALHHGQDPNGVHLTQRANGDLIALFYINHFNLTDRIHYSINSGSGFGSAITAPGTQPARLMLTADGNDTHFIGRNASTTLYHWRLNASDTLSSQQTATSMFDNNNRFTADAAPLVHEGTMYIPAHRSGGGLIVTSAPTGSDAPTWTKTTVTTRAISEIHGFVHGLGGVPTFVYVEASTWKVWRAWLDGGSWVEEDTGQTVPTFPGDAEQSGFGQLVRTQIFQNTDANGRAWLWWQRNRRPSPERRFTDISWYLLAANMNRLALHTTDVVLVEGSQVVAHSTDVTILARETRTHTTDVVLSELAEAAVFHETDVRLTLRPVIAHTTDVHVAFLTTLTHTTDVLIVPTPHDIEATIDLGLELHVTLEQGNKPGPTGQGIVREDRHAPRIYNPDRKVVKR